jgi:hypothetical protein
MGHVYISVRVAIRHQTHKLCVSNREYVKGYTSKAFSTRCRYPWHKKWDRALRLLRHYRVLAPWILRVHKFSTKSGGTLQHYFFFLRASPSTF